jgi:NAD(P)-dependent dehydrogenase (short-subunit alcohol dehydrogenase family)
MVAGVVATMGEAAYDPGMNDDPAPALPADKGSAVIIGTGALGTALADTLRGPYRHVFALGRRSEPALDLTQEATIAAAATWLGSQCEAAGSPLRLIVVASGFLHGPAGQPERSWQALDLNYLMHSFLINAAGPALLMKHFLPLLPRQAPCKAVFLSAKVGSVGDNQLGGWYGYRAAKAALNQLVKTASIELARRNRQGAIVALHPGTVDSPLSAPFSKSGLDVRSPPVAAAQIAQVIEALGPADNGRFLDYRGQGLPW